MQGSTIELGGYEQNYDGPQEQQQPQVDAYPFQRPEAQAPNQLKPEGESENMLIDEINDPPLLEELGIDPVAVKNRVLQIFKFAYGLDKNFFEDTDLSGPLLIAILFGAFLMLV